MSESDVLTLVIATLALLVSCFSYLYDRSKDRARIDISCSTIGEHALEVSIVNAGHRPLYLMDVAFTQDGGAESHPLLPSWRLVEEHVVEAGRARVLQPWEPLQYTVPAGIVRREVTSGYTWISVYDSRSRAHREVIPDWVRRNLDVPPDASRLADAAE